MFRHLIHTYITYGDIAHQVTKHESVINVILKQHAAIQ